MPGIVLSTQLPLATPTPRSLLGHGVCTFLFDPASSPMCEPACWQADVCPFVLQIQGARRRSSLPASSYECDMTDRSGRYLVKRCAVGAHRLELGIDTAENGPRVELPLDASLGVRLACLEAYASGTSSWSTRLRPTTYQVGRLALMLAILDRLDDCDNPLVQTRIIAAELVFPGAELPRRAIEWKSSGYRRQTQRILATAKSMCDRGYRSLLCGHMPVAASRASRTTPST